MQSAIKINNISHSFKEKKVLKGIDLEIKKGGNIWSVGTIGRR